MFCENNHAMNTLLFKFFDATFVTYRLRFFRTINIHLIFNEMDILVNVTFGKPIMWICFSCIFFSGETGVEVL